MMKNVFTKTLYQKRLVLLWWFLAFLGMVVLTTIFFPAFKNGGLAQSFDSLPKGLQSIIGNAASFRTIGGYISQEVFSLRMPLLTIILAVSVFNGLTVGDERRGVLEAQLSLPLSRFTLLAQKLAAGLGIVLLASIGTFLGVLLGVVLIHEHASLVKIFQETLGCALLSVDFGLLTFMLGSGFGNKGLTIGLSSGVAFGSYLITSMASTVTQLRGIEKLSLFHYYHDPSAFNLHQLLLLTAVGMVLIFVGFTLFLRRDVKT